MNWSIIIPIIGVIGTWIGVYLAYRAIKKENQSIIVKLRDFFNFGDINSNNKYNLQKGMGNKNVQ
jgi:hypothetical protein